MTGAAVRRGTELPLEPVPILVTARNARNLELLEQLLTEAGYAPIAANSLDELDRAVDDRAPALAVLDADGFGGELWSRCDALRATETPFLVASANASAARRDGLRHGARTVLSKPVGKRELLAVIEAILRNP